MEIEKEKENRKRLEVDATININETVIKIYKFDTICAYVIQYDTIRNDTK